MILNLSDGTGVRLSIARARERQARVRLPVPPEEKIWRYAPLIDVMVAAAGSGEFRFTGKNVQQWLEDLRVAKSLDLPRVVPWVQSVAEPWCARLREVVAAAKPLSIVTHPSPRFFSNLRIRMEALPLRRAPISQWTATIAALVQKGVKSEEIDESVIIPVLSELPPDRVLTQAEVLDLIRFALLQPQIVSEAEHRFSAASGWKSWHYEVPAKEFRRRRLIGRGAEARHVIRFRHRSMGWMIVRTKYSDLVTRGGEWWGVLDEKGRYVREQGLGFIELADAMLYAEDRIAERFDQWGQRHALNRWQRYSLAGGDEYKELLIQLPGWPTGYMARHFRVKNVLVHVRATVRSLPDRKRVLFLDELQSDWHSDLRDSMEQGEWIRDARPVPFKKEWPLLALKMMLWWAQRQGLNGMAWSTWELQKHRWKGYDPPELLYRKTLPDAAAAIAKALGCSSGTVTLPVSARTLRVEAAEDGWLVRDLRSGDVTRGFSRELDAVEAAEATDRHFNIRAPVLWLDGVPEINALPLWGCGPLEAWFHPPAHSLIA